MAQSAPLVSIIIPCYNHAETLPRLFDSILRQSIKSLEIIVVDDGSERSPHDVVTAYANKGAPVRLLSHAANQGAKNARLTGIENARGAIIGFADADDELYGATALEEHANIMVRESADIVQFNSLFADIATGEATVHELNRPLAPALEGDAVFATYVELQGRGGTMWCKLYSRSLCLTDLETCRRSKVRYACEDYYLSAWFLFHSKRYRSTETVGYRYNNDFEATKARLAAGRITDLFHVIQEFIPYIRARGCPEEVIAKFYGNTLRMMKRNLQYGSGEIMGGDPFLPLLSSETFANLCGRVEPEGFMQALYYGYYHSQLAVDDLLNTIGKQRKRIAALMAEKKRIS